MSAGATYRLLDSGAGRKLEQVGPVRVDRQAQGALWSPRLPQEEWEQADAHHVRSRRGGGHWEMRRRIPASWVIRHGGLDLEVRATPFGHLGVFPEQEEAWDWLRRKADPAGGEPPDVLNLFAYTGGASLALAQAGARVCHVDAAHGVVDWARRNAALNDLAGRPVRWIVDDCLAFLRREARRGHRYQGLVLDPPSFGRGRGRRVFKIEQHLQQLLEAAAAVLAPRPRLVLLSCHTPGLTPLVLENLLRGVLGDLPYQCGELVVPEVGGRPLPCGAFCRAACPAE